MRTKGGHGRPKLRVGKSGIFGKGLFALSPIPAGTRVIEYSGTRKRWEDFQEHPEHYVYLFAVGRDEVIDPFDGGNRARYINHSCDANCEAIEEEGRVYIHALRDISPGEELCYDYGLVLGKRPSKADRERYACRCGSRNCRGTMLRLPPSLLKGTRASRRP